MITCCKCNKEKEDSEFYFNKKGKLNSKNCKDCSNKQYLKRKDKLFVPEKEPIPYRCSYIGCNCIIPNGGSYTTFYQKRYCNEWCKEMANLPKVKHICKMCGVATSKVPSPHGGYYRTYRVLCDDCYVKKYGVKYIPIWQRGVDKLP